MVLLALEALPAKHGDCLLLHYGDEEEPELVVIDGGPAGVYASALRPRLEALRRARAIEPDDPLPIRLLMVSHIDDDHIRGVLDLTKELRERQVDRRPLPFRIEELWHNSFDDILGNRAEELVTASTAAVAAASRAPGDLPVSRPAALVLASVPQGRQLRDDARGLRLTVNAMAGGKAIATSAGAHAAEVGLTPSLRLRVLGPARDQLEALQREWDEVLRRRGLAEEERQARAAALLDRSVFNLSSLIVLAEADGKRILLTGDARGDHILRGLEEAGLLASGPLHVDVLKLPHHGSNRNVDVEFFRRVTADHYVASGDGRHHNPEVETFRMIAEARGDAAYTLHLTYPVEAFHEDYPKQDLLALLDELRHANGGVAVRFPDQGGASLRIDLL